MTDEKWQTLLDNFVRDATKLGELSKSQTRNRLNYILSEHTRRIVGELEGMKIIPMRVIRAIETRSLKIKHWNHALDEAIRRIKSL